MSPRAAWRLEALGFTDVYHYAAGKADWGAYGLPVEGTVTNDRRIADVARTDVPTCRPGETVGQIRARSRGWGTCFVVNDDRVVLGRVMSEGLDGDPAARVEDVMREGPSTFRPNVSVAQMLDYMNDNSLDTAPVTRSDGTLVGLLLREDAEKALSAAGLDRARTVERSLL